MTSTNTDPKEPTQRELTLNHSMGGHRGNPVEACPRCAVDIGAPGLDTPMDAVATTAMRALVGSLPFSGCYHPALEPFTGRIDYRKDVRYTLRDFIAAIQCIRELTQENLREHAAKESEMRDLKRDLEAVRRVFGINPS